jgi:hypothetical protein
MRQQNFLECGAMGDVHLIEHCISVPRAPDAALPGIVAMNENVIMTCDELKNGFWKRRSLPT